MSINFQDRTTYLRKLGRESRAKTSAAGNELGVLSKEINIYSDGVRLSATIWRPDEHKEPKSPVRKRPAILLCHGWGGIKDHLDSGYAPKFAAEGFICLTFDYRTWGSSHGVVLPNVGMPEGYDNMSSNRIVANIECSILKKVVDPEWQLRDIQSCLDYLQNLEGVDHTKIGIWGSSMGGGHVISIGGLDHLEGRIKCIVSQLGMMIASDLLKHVGALDTVDTGEEYSIAGFRASKSLPPISQDQSDMLKDLDGYPNLAKLRKYRPMDYAPLVSVPTLILDASDEELWDRTQQGKRVHQTIIGNGIDKKYALLKGKHYDGYALDKSFNEGCSQAISWFTQHLKTSKKAICKK